MQTSSYMNAFLLIICLLFFSHSVRSISSSEYVFETFDMDEENTNFIETTNNFKIRNTIKNSINNNNRYKRGLLNNRDL